MVSTFLDPNFDISAFEPNFQNTVKSKIIALTKISEAKQTALNPIENSEVSVKRNSLNNNRNDNFKKNGLDQREIVHLIGINRFVSKIMARKTQNMTISEINV